jgi:CDP-diacylglycerol--serine O-phosphatidyltransferase
MAFYFVGLGIFLISLMVFFARLFKVAGPLGLQLDSLADMVYKLGVAPGFVMYFYYQIVNMKFHLAVSLLFLGFITLGSCYRLANF